MPPPRILRSLSDIPAHIWDGLHDGSNPFVTHAFLHGLEAHGCLRPEWGWTPWHMTLWEQDTLLAAVPGYLKQNSHGEFVFDHAWAHAYERHGVEYYPKWLGAVPYSPVTGPRLLARDATHATRLLDAITEWTSANGLSSAHINFHETAEDCMFGQDWLLREDIQYHWTNPGHWTTFDDYLADMDHKHRKNIRQERARVDRAGIRFRVVHGDEATGADLQAMHGFYLQTFLDYGNAPALTREFLDHLATALPRQLVLILALDGDAPIAGALCLRGGDTLYGRYWGGATLPGLHFETCYYQGIAYCLAQGLRRFEPGAQGQHKLARGFLPTVVRSRHWMADPGFADALAAWCAQERDEVAAQRHALMAHSPFRVHPHHE